MHMLSLYPYNDASFNLHLELENCTRSYGDTHNTIKCDGWTHGEHGRTYHGGLNKCSPLLGGDGGGGGGRGA